MYKNIKTVKHSFVVRDNDEAKFTAIRIDEGKFEGVIYFYDDIQMGEETPDGELNLHFTVRVAKSDTEAFNELPEEFHNICGDILISCMEKGLRKEDSVDIIYREDDSESFAQQREVQSESITLSED